MCSEDTHEARRRSKLAELRETLALAVQEPEANLRVWWQGVFHGRLIELEAAGVLSAEDCAAIADQIKATFEHCRPPANDE